MTNLVNGMFVTVFFNALLCNPVIDWVMGYWNYTQYYYTTVPDNTQHIHAVFCLPVYVNTFYGLILPRKRPPVERPTTANRQHNIQCDIQRHRPEP